MLNEPSTSSLLNIFLESSLSGFPLVAWPLLAVLVLIVEILFRKPRLSLGVTVFGLVSMLLYALLHFQWSSSGDSQLSTMIFFEAVKFDRIAQFFNILSIAIVLGVVLLSLGQLDCQWGKNSKIRAQLPEYLLCLVFGGFGASVTVSANDLTVFFLGIETLSVAIYALCGLFRWDIRSTESALKYLLIGAFSTVILLYGLTLLYGATGSTNLDTIMVRLGEADPVLSLLAILFLVAGLAFKLALVPFHMYIPDVYEGAPTAITAFLSTIVKLAALGGGFRLLWETAGILSDIWKPLWLSLCVLSIVLGNISALRQRSLKKLLAFSSISHGGFLGLALLVAEPRVVDGLIDLSSLYPMLSYLLIYSVMSLGMFGVVLWVENREKIFLVDDLRALGVKRFWVGALFALFALGLAGIPPFAGFFIKFVVFQELIAQGYVWAAIFAVLGSIIGAGYYLRILMLLFMSEEEGAAHQWGLSRDRLLALRLVLVISGLLTLVGGLQPNLYSDWIFLTLGLK